MSLSRPVTDALRPTTVARSEHRMDGRVWSVVTETVLLPSGESVVRDVVRHPSAVAVLALDEQDNALVINQYRHPVGATLWEIPAGLLDVAGEDPLAAARRELWEEANHEGGTWSVLLDFFTSPGFCDEAIRVYLARGVQVSSGEVHPRHGEERDMPVEWVPLDELRAQVLSGSLHSPVMVTSVLAACVARADHWAQLRPADAAWPLGPRQLR